MLSSPKLFGLKFSLYPGIGLGADCPLEQTSPHNSYSISDQPYIGSLFYCSTFFHIFSLRVDSLGWHLFATVIHGYLSPEPVVSQWSASRLRDETQSG